MPRKPAARTYADAGVNLDAAAAVKERIKKLAASATTSGVVSGPGFFGGVFDPDPVGDILLVATTDSVGTKLRIAEAMGRHDTIGVDIVNHCVNDILPAGATPLFFLDYIGISSFDEERIAEIVKGVAAGCAAAGCALLGGETATLPGIYHGKDYDLVGFMVGSVLRGKLLRPENTRPGDVLLGLPSSGLHTNGYSLVRSIFDTDSSPRALSQRVPGTDRTLGEALLEPHRSYLAPLRPVLGHIKGLAHITGGGFFKNLPRSLADGLCAEVNLASWETPPLFRFIQQAGSVDAMEMFRVYNMGVGMVVIVDPHEAEKVSSQIPGVWLLGQVVEQTGPERVRLI